MSFFSLIDGTTPGTFGTSPAPEPAHLIPAGLSLIGFGLIGLGRRKQ
jgi:MYXO-CTERM domain-containing protein